MAGFRSIARWSFGKLYSFGEFSLQAKSTKWPGLCRSAIYILFVALLLSIAQATLHLWLAITLSNLPSEVKGCYEGNGLAGFPMPHEKTYRPVTYADIRGKRGFSVRANSSNGTIALAAALPFMTLLLLCMTVFLHFSNRGMQNRDGVLFGLVLLLSYLGSLGASVFLDIDTDDIRTDFDWCWLDRTQITPLSAAREARLRIRTAVGVVIGFEIACAVLYILTSFYAARSNVKSVRALGRRLEDLSPDSTLVDNHVAPNNVGNHNGDGHLPPQDPFSNHENIVTTADGQNIDEIATYTPSGHPFVDPTPASQTTNEVSDVHLANGEQSGCCMGHCEHHTGSAIEVKCELASSEKTLGVRYRDKNAGVETRGGGQSSRTYSTSHANFNPQEIANVNTIKIIKEDVTLEETNPFEVGSGGAEDVDNAALATTENIPGYTGGTDICRNAKVCAAEGVRGEVTEADSGEYEDKTSKTIENNGENTEEAPASSHTNKKVRGKKGGKGKGKKGVRGR